MTIEPLAADPYRPPVADARGPRAPEPREGLPVRLAGAFLLARSLWSTHLAWYRADTLRELPDSQGVLAGTLVVLLAPLAVDLALAVPLLAGSLRLRVLTWVRACSIVALPLLQGALSMVLRPRPDLGTTVSTTLWEAFSRNTFPAALVAAALVLLVHRGRHLWRTTAGLASVALYLFWVAFIRS